MEELMSSVRRVYVEKKPAFAVQAKDLRHELRKYLGVSGLTGVRVLIRYDVEIYRMMFLKKHARPFLQNRR